MVNTLELKTVTGSNDDPKKKVSRRLQNNFECININLNEFKYKCSAINYVLFYMFC